MFFSKMILMGDEDVSTELRIRHYDIECEAATNIFDILTTKVKAVQLKCLHILKGNTSSEMRRSNSRTSYYSEVRSYRGYPITTYTRTPLNTQSTTNLRHCPTEYYSKDTKNNQYRRDEMRR